jgi:HAD superfamily hydrolase (TIGR01484 family)
MRYLALASDYDGTLAHHGRVDGPTVAALERLRATGRKLLLVTGRELPELLAIFPQVNYFEWVVAENGALLYRPASREEQTLAAPPPEKFIETLRQRGVAPLSVGRVIVATWHPHETTILESIRDLGLEMQVIFNKDAVMVLPAGVNKATGLAAALAELKMSPHNVVGVGDAENDHAFLRLCECSAAVANALPMVKETADVVTRGDHGSGVTELIEQLVADDLKGLEGRLERHYLHFGRREDGTDVNVWPYGTSLLIAGPSGSGKSTAATALLERLGQHQYQYCVIDPEGDYETSEDAVVVGTSKQGPSLEEVLRLLERPGMNVVVTLVGLALADRPAFFLKLLPRLLEMRAQVGRPHWLLVDEVHHLMPATWEPTADLLPPELDRMVFITVHPAQVAPAMLSRVDTVVAVGQAPEKTLADFCRAVGVQAPAGTATELEPGEVLWWLRKDGEPPYRVRILPSRAERRRHTRKYAEGELPPDRSFYFRGPEEKLNLRAQNLILFLQMADGVDDDTWMHHLRRSDYSRWFREKIKNDELAAETEAVERMKRVSPAESRRLIRQVVEKYYTQPASTPLPMPGTDAATHSAR